MGRHHIAIQSNLGAELGSMLHLQAGTRVRILPLPGKVSFPITSLGLLEIDLSQIRQVITPLALKMSDADDSDPARDLSNSPMTNA